MNDVKSGEKTPPVDKSGHSEPWLIGMPTGDERLAEMRERAKGNTSYPDTYALAADDRRFLLAELARVTEDRDEQLKIINAEFHKRGRIGPVEHDRAMVICPHCTSQFAAISVADQQARREAAEHIASLHAENLRHYEAIEKLIEGRDNTEYRAAVLARAIFELGDINADRRCYRLQFMVGTGMHDEKPAGGLIESALAKFLTEQMRHSSALARARGDA